MLYCAMGKNVMLGCTSDVKILRIWNTTVLYQSYNAA